MKVIALLAATAVLSIAGPADLPPQFSHARAFYYRGSDGDKGAYGEADKLFSELHSEHAGDPRIEVYYGSLRLLEASHTWALWKKNSLSKEGIQLMDAAVKAAPDNLEIRFVRAATTYDLPGFFHRKAQSEQDFTYLAQHAVEAASIGALEPRLAAASLYFHAEFLSGDGKNDAAIAAWKQAISLAPQSRAARDSREELKNFESSAPAGTP